mmetsp:Transcript_71404/g.190328  ORF Transcript_71404/g.190328 Transcript_71404/m.190328 type:complete len:208 (-) Transcript_71404:2784-3407(-)
MSLHFCSSTVAFSAFSATIAFSLPTCSANASAASAFSFTTTAFSFSSSSSPATCSCVSRSFSRPFVRRVCLSCKASTFRPNIPLYNLMNSKNDFGVVYENRLCSFKYLSDCLFTKANENGKKSTAPRRSGASASPKISVSVKNLRATDNSASSGQGWNQSITVHVTKAGNLRARARIASPTGEKQIDMCKFFLMRPMKNVHRFSGVS